MKNTFRLLVIVLGLLLGGFWLVNTYIYNAKQAERPPLTIPRDSIAAGIVTEIDTSGALLDGPVLIEFQTVAGDTDEIALPSMGMALCDAQNYIANPYNVTIDDQIVVRGERDTEGRIVPCISEAHYMQVSTTYTSEEVPVQASYRVGPNGYVATKHDVPLSNHSEFISGIELVARADAEAQLLSDAPREYPPTLSLRMYHNPDSLSLIDWIRTHAPEVGADRLLNTSVTAEVAGMPARTYMADGLYAAQVYVIQYDEYIIVYRGEFIDEEKTRKADFEAFVLSLQLGA